MKLIPVSSSAISEIGWHKQVGLLVRFRGGAIWCYDDDDHALFDAIMTAPSKGKAFDQLVKKRNVRGVEIAEKELGFLLDDGDAPPDVGLKRASSPVAYLRELLRTNRASAYF